MRYIRLTLSMVPRAVRHPGLAVDLFRVMWRFRRRGWWYRFPFMPLPSREYVKWRMLTAYGDYDATPPADDLERYARWSSRR